MGSATSFLFYCVSSCYLRYLCIYQFPFCPNALSRSFNNPQTFYVTQVFGPLNSIREFPFHPSHVGSDGQVRCGKQFKTCDCHSTIPSYNGRTQTNHIYKIPFADVAKNARNANALPKIFHSVGWRCGRLSCPIHLNWICNHLLGWRFAQSLYVARHLSPRNQYWALFYIKIQLIRVERLHAQREMRRTRYMQCATETQQTWEWNNDDNKATKKMHIMYLTAFMVILNKLTHSVFHTCMHTVLRSHVRCHKRSRVRLFLISYVHCIHTVYHNEDANMKLNQKKRTQNNKHRPAMLRSRAYILSIEQKQGVPRCVIRIPF